MFNDTIVVQSAVSAFNNAALAAPAFFWWALLAMPLFGMTYYYGNAFIGRFGWTKDNMLRRMCLTIAAMTLIWMVAFGGNYAVLRDSASVLPCTTAFILFIIAHFIASHTTQYQIPRWRGATRRKKTIIATILVAIIGAIAMTDTHTWWGPILQVVAFFAGAILGRRGKRQIPYVAGINIITMVTTTIILMQPEFFRFGQLGNLSPIHIIAMIMMGSCFATNIAVRYVNPRSKIHHSAYIKLKWLARFITALAIVLFIMTESVPVFIGTIAAIFMLIALSIWHRDTIAPDIARRAFAAQIMIFGIITGMHAITAIGIIYWTMIPKSPFWSDIRTLL